MNWYRDIQYTAEEREEMFKLLKQACLSRVSKLQDKCKFLEEICVVGSDFDCPECYESMILVAEAEDRYYEVLDRIKKALYFERAFVMLGTEDLAGDDDILDSLDDSGAFREVYNEAHDREVIPSWVRKREAYMERKIRDRNLKLWMSNNHKESLGEELYCLVMRDIDNECAKRFLELKREKKQA